MAAIVSSACAVLPGEGRPVVARAQDGNATCSNGRRDGVECAIKCPRASRRRMASAVRCAFNPLVVFLASNLCFRRGLVYFFESLGKFCGRVLDLDPVMTSIVFSCQR